MINIDALERKILFGSPSDLTTRFEQTVRQSSNASTQGMPTAEELRNYQTYGVFVIQTDTGVARGNFIFDNAATAVLCHPDDEQVLKETLKRLAVTQRKTK